MTNELSSSKENKGTKSKTKRTRSYNSLNLSIEAEEPPPLIESNTTSSLSVSSSSQDIMQTYCKEPPKVADEDNYVIGDGEESFYKSKQYRNFSPNIIND